MGGPGQVVSENVIEHLARQIGRWRLESAAILCLEVTKPLSFIASQGLLLCEPLLGFFYKEPQISEYADLLADRSSVERLLSCLERDMLVRGNHGEEKG
jgi:hypothetical protein